MIITLYVNKDDNRKLNKILTSDYTISNVSVYSECSIVKPILKLRFFTEITNYNYVYIPDFNRYYFISDIVLSKGETAFLYLKCDVLMSNRNDILNTRQTIIRYNDITNDYVRNTVVTDTLLPVTKDLVNYGLVLFRGGSWNRFYHDSWNSEYCYVLQTVGGGD
jgi:hypothetical protein